MCFVDIDNKYAYMLYLRHCLWSNNSKYGDDASLECYMEQIKYTRVYRLFI